MSLLAYIMSLRFILDHLKTQEMCEKAVEKSPYQLGDFPDRFETQEMCIKAVEDEPDVIEYVTDHFKTEEMCEKAAEDDSWKLRFVLDYFKTRDICDDAAWRDPSYLQFAPDWFVTRENTALWHDCLASEYCHNDEDNFFKWYEGYKKQKAQKASIKEELMSIAWHPSRYWDWWSSEDEKKKRQKNFGGQHRLFCV